MSKILKYDINILQLDITDQYPDIETARRKMGMQIWVNHLIYSIVIFKILKQDDVYILENSNEYLNINSE